MPLPNVTIEDAVLPGFMRNFTGKEGQYNAEGERNFCVLLNDDMAKDLERDGWNVKYLKPREEGDNPQPYLQVKLQFKKGRPPLIAMITSKGRTILDEDSVMLLDWADMRMVDLIIRPHEWGPINGKTGVKAYLKTLFVTIEEDYLELKYADVPDARALPPGRALTEDEIWDAEVIEDELEAHEVRAIESRKE